MRRRFSAPLTDPSPSLFPPERLHVEYNKLFEPSWIQAYLNETVDFECDEEGCRCNPVVSPIAAPKEKGKRGSQATSKGGSDSDSNSDSDSDEGGGGCAVS